MVNIRPRTRSADDQLTVVVVVVVIVVVVVLNCMATRRNFKYNYTILLRKKTFVVEKRKMHLNSGI